MDVVSQSKLFAEELKRLRNDITKQDRIESMTSIGIKSPATISNYLNGKVRDNDTAAALIAFFKNRIAKRSEVLA